MITLKNAKYKAEEITNAKIPKFLSLHNWKNAGVISKPESYINDSDTGGRSGIFPNKIVIEIVVAAELKEKYSLKQIAKARSDLLNGLDNIKKLKNNELINEIIKEDISINTAPERLMGIIILKEYANKYKEVFYRLEKFDVGLKTKVN